MGGQHPTDALVERAWQGFSGGDRALALELAQQACTPSPAEPHAAAALGYFLLDAGRLDEAATVLHPACTRAPHYAPLHWYDGLLALRQGHTRAASEALRRACQLDASLDEAAFTLAWALHDLGQFAEALSWARHALAAERSAPRLLQLGWLQQCLGQCAEACATYREAMDALPPRAAELAQLHLHLAQCQAALGQPAAARSALEEGLALFADDPHLLTELARLEWQEGARPGAIAVATRLTEMHPEHVAGWHLLGVFLQESGELQAADQAFNEVQQRDLSCSDALLRRAQLQARWGRPVDAHWLLQQVLRQDPDCPPAQDLLAQVLLDLQRHDEARRLLLTRLRAQPSHGELWRLLAVAHARQGRRARARLALGRALRLDPANVEALRLLAWTAHEQGDRAAAAEAVRQVLARRPGEAAAQVQAAFILAAAGELAAASRYAEGALAAAPDEAEAWRALSQVRYQQGRLDEAEDAIEQALRLAPGRMDSLRQLGWIFVADHRPGHAELAFLRARELAPQDPVPLLELAEVRLRAGRFEEGLASVRELHALCPHWPPARLLEARLLAEGGASQGRSDWLDAALALCRRLLADPGQLGDAAAILVRLLGLGVAAARPLCALLPWPVWKASCQRALAEAVTRHGHDYLMRLAAIAAQTFRQDAWFSFARLYVASLDQASDPATLAFAARQAYRRLKLEAGLSASWGARPPRRGAARLRIAYLASQQHERLLAPVLAGHDPARVEVFVYSPRPLAGLPAHVHCHALEPEQLAASCAANQVDVVIDAGGLHPFEGQEALLSQYARRLAPLQIGWLGCWATAGGLFDVLLGDAAALPPEHEGNYTEALWRLDGGQWSWAPPEHAPPPLPPPSQASGFVTFGVTARGLRLSPATLDAFARVLVATPRSRLRFIGAAAGDWPQRAAILAHLQELGVGAERVDFDPPRSYEGLLDWLQQIDLVLDSFPGNGGLSLPDALWMGVPVVSRAGAWAGARQGLSVLTALGLQAWVADSDAGFVTTAVALAADGAARTAHRASLRQRMRASPLLDGRRLARQIEARCAAWVATHAAPLPSTDPKQWVREHARRSLQTWLDKRTTLQLPALPAQHTPDLSVVIVLHGQAGLSLRTLQALADQRGAAFETLIVDNASGDETGQLLERVRGARIIRNPDNRGFLLAANQGAALARGRHLLFLNNDAIVQQDALALTLQQLDADPAIGALGGRIVLMSGGLQEAGNALFRDGSALGIGRGEDPFSPAAMASRSTDYCSGVYLAVPAPLWRMLGGFDPAYAPAYYEDADFCVRVWQAGFRVVYEPAVLVEHLEWGSAGSGEAEQRMRDNRRRFLARQRSWLEQQPSARPVPLDGDRWRSPADHPRRPRILMLENEVPHMARGGGLPRARLVLQALQDWPVTLFPLWWFEDDWGAVYASLPRSTEVMLGLGMAGLESFLERRRGLYDVLWVSRPPNLKALQPLRERRPELFEGLHIIYDSEALFALREIGEAAVKGRPLTPAQAHARLQAELEQARGVHRSVVVSDIDAQHFRAAGHEVAILSHAIAVRRDVPTATQRQGLLFVGALHPDTPNEDGLLWFVEEVLPRLGELLPAPPPLRVVGECRSSRIAALAGPQLEVLGAQAELAPHYDQTRVFIAPARFAGGVPLKVIEAAAHGIPVVASALLVEQLGWQDGRDIRSAADAATFARALARLLQDDTAWQQQQQAAWATCQTRYAPQEFMRAVRELVCSAAAP